METTGIGFKHTGGYGDNSIELLFFHQCLAQLLMCLGGAEQYTIGYNAGTATTRFELFQEQVDEQ